jgi:hypothetical protein
MEISAKEPALPSARGGISAAVADHLRGTGPLPDGEVIAGGSPLEDDWQLGLYLCYELHYRSFAGVDAALEWDPALLKVRASLEQPFLKA